MQIFFNQTSNLRQFEDFCKSASLLSFYQSINTFHYFSLMQSSGHPKFNQSVFVATEKPKNGWIIIFLTNLDCDREL